jgi:hypothetical protein
MSEDQSLADYLNEINASRDVVQQALRYYLAQESNDLPPEDMRELLAAESGDPSEVDIQLAALAQSSDDLEEAALAYLSLAWTDPGERNRVRGALAAANKSLPVVEGIVLATVAMYAMYLLVTGGKAKETRIVHREADGSYKEKVETVYASPKPWLQSVFGLFRRDQSEDVGAT